ncbi:MAG: non-heme iron oxygenase ferredoxin subunit [Nitrososphaerota archaeon]|jgi:3-phenylpropionate/trans-cinnamate dioxygenase ferredoxin subunit|nr:non-heme iron oxygenase ferredoxin subunit [Nitrososphaerota archaeon]MDG6942171.1 non-heme iron oxygenase ferredoxin subunit [Nitrososphaerota archaeon]MDG6942636.1 non-heme iron oxygenase ferredoxin subunit [Nitrososphaerota archaeon]MDG6948423.1 non-heme iron oxygenase ferredoxin subunit [Nitrososphaerota archaeon]MDG6950349.1 non-heme iron oxygenase ferredoxin subunit [Nitrososphaerota archaeon]
MRSVDLPEGSMSAVDVNGTHILLAKIGGEVFAVSGTCTHEDADLGQGFILEGRVVCPLHLSQFDLRTGEAVTPPATDSLKRYRTRVDRDTIYVEV